MKKYDPQANAERLLPLGFPRLSISLPALVKFIGEQMITSAEELEAEKQPAEEAQASEETVEEKQADEVAEVTEEPTEEEVQLSENHVEESQDEEEKEASS